MKVRVSVGEVTIRCDGLELTQRGVLQLLRAAARVAAAMPPTPAEEDPRAPFGFAALVERADPVVEDFSWYFDE
jgi:hypothetical protein